jgi:N-acetylmuramoyl-L-alanine amidase
VAVLFCVAVSFCFARTDPFSYPLRTVVLDAGHGGKDGGASSAWSFAGGTIQEKDFILDIAKRVADLLAVAQPPWNIVMTRADDTFSRVDDRDSHRLRRYSPEDLRVFVSINVTRDER